MKLKRYDIESAPYNFSFEESEEGEVILFDDFEAYDKATQKSLKNEKQRTENAKNDKMQIILREAKLLRRIKDLEACIIYHGGKIPPP